MTMTMIIHDEVDDDDDDLDQGMDGTVSLHLPRMKGLYGRGEQKKKKRGNCIAPTETNVMIDKAHKSCLSMNDS